MAHSFFSLSLSRVLLASVLNIITGARLGLRWNGSIQSEKNDTEHTINYIAMVLYKSNELIFVGKFVQLTYCHHTTNERNETNESRYISALNPFWGWRKRAARRQDNS